MAQRKRRGFTIVELVIVIAVIAILAGVLIPTFISVINKANVASDTSLVRNINEALIAEEVTEGKPATMSKALELAERNGFTVEKLTPRSTGDIVWNSASNRFALVDEDGNVVYSANDEDVPHNATVWKIAHKTAEIDQTYSTYLAYNVTEDLPTFVTGVDVGANQGLDIAYAHSGTKQSVVINMNGGKLTVNAPQDDVYRHGTADSVVITAVAPTSYHECGVVQGNIELANGRVVFEKGASAAAVKVVVEASAITNGSAVIAVDNKEATTVSIVMSKAVQDAITEKGGNNKIEASEDSVVTDPTVIENMSKFAGGLGTEASPYLIATAEQFKNISIFSSDMAKGNGYHFELISDIDISDRNDWFASSWWGNSFVSVFAGSLEGHDHRIICRSTVDDSYFIFGDLAGETKLSNLQISHKDSIRPVRINNGNRPSASIAFYNVDVVSYVDGSVFELENNGSLYTTYAGHTTIDNFAYAPATYVFDGCDVKLNINSVGYTGLYLGQKIYGASTSVRVDNCSYEGQYLGTKVGIIQGNTSNEGTLTINNFVNKGTVGSTIGMPTIAGGAGITSTTTKEPLSGNVTHTNCNWGVMTYLHDDKLAISLSASGLTVSKASLDNEKDVTYSITFVGGTRLFYDSNWNLLNAENSSFTFTVELNTLNTPFMAGYFVTKKQFAELALTSTVLGSYTTTVGDKFDLHKASSGEIYYVFDFVGNFAFGSNDRMGNCTLKPVSTREATVLCYNAGVLHATARCDFVPAK